MIKVKIIKYQALGNDYLIFDPKMNGGTVRLSKKQIQAICDRHFGVGSDGILMGPLNLKRKSGDLFHLRIFNPDGSEALKSGNGIRIFSAYLRDSKQWNPKKEKLGILLPSGEAWVTEIKKGFFRVAMGKPQFPESKKQNYRGGYPVFPVSVGNPHFVVLVPGKDRKTIHRLAKEMGPSLERDRLFEDGTNVQFVQVLDRKTVQIEIWERGAGYTLASGSSSTAVFAVLRKLGKVDSQIKMQMPGGELDLQEDEKGFLWMTGPASKVAFMEMECP